MSETLVSWSKIAVTSSSLAESSKAVPLARQEQMLTDQTLKSWVLYLAMDREGPRMLGLPNSDPSSRVNPAFGLRRFLGSLDSLLPEGLPDSFAFTERRRFLSESTNGSHIVTQGNHHAAFSTSVHGPTPRFASFGDILTMVCRFQFEKMGSGPRPVFDELVHPLPSRIRRFSGANQPSRVRQRVILVLVQQNVVALVHLLEVFSFGIRTSRMSMLDSIITHRTVPPSQLATIRIDERKTSKGLKTFRSTGGLIPSRPTSGFVLDPQGDTPLGSFSLGNVDRVPGFIIPSLPQFFPSRQTGNGLMVALISGTNLSRNLTGQDPARITL